MIISVISVVVLLLTSVSSGILVMRVGLVMVVILTVTLLTGMGWFTVICITIITLALTSICLAVILGRIGSVVVTLTSIMVRVVSVISAMMVASATFTLILGLGSLVVLRTSSVSTGIMMIRWLVVPTAISVTASVRRGTVLLMRVILRIRGCGGRAVAVPPMMRRLRTSIASAITGMF